MKNINDFIDNRVEIGMLTVSQKEQAVKRETQLMDEIARFIGDEATSHRVLGKLDDHIFNLTGVFARYAYLQGLKDGAKINKILA